MKVKKGDTVVVIAGKDKGAKGKVIQAYPETGKVLVEGVNRIKKHTKISQTQRGAQSGGIVTQEAPINVSNVMVVDSDGKPTRVGYRTNDEGKRVRIPVVTGRTSDHDYRREDHPAAQDALPRRGEVRAAEAVQLRQRDADPGRRQGRRQHGRRRRRP
jgi:large subunit ribosomal protein L24